MIGERNLIRFSKPLLCWAPKASTKPNGNRSSTIGCRNRARSALQKSLRTNVRIHHSRQCCSVRRSILSTCQSRFTLPSLRPMHHGRDQNHHDPYIDLPAQKTHRRRRLALTASLPGTAKTVALLPLRSSPRLSRIVPPMQVLPRNAHTPLPAPSTPNPYRLPPATRILSCLGVSSPCGSFSFDRSCSENKKPHGAPSSSVR